MGSAQCHWNSASPETVCHGIGVGSAGRVKRDCDQIGLDFKIDGAHNFTGMKCLPIRRNQGRKTGMVIC